MQVKGAYVGDKSVLVAMSGGVDSSVAALLLRDAGYNAVGVTLKLYDNDDVFFDAPADVSATTLVSQMCGDGATRDSACNAEALDSCGLVSGASFTPRTCCSLDDVEDARSAARKLGISHYTFNFKAAFSQQVMDRFCAAYLQGLTPNPCIDCNRYIKFEALQRRRRELGMDYVATGHYARRDFDRKSGRYVLKRAHDEAKDQSYVLCHLTQDQLAHMLFPLGELEKSEVRQLARAAGLRNADKRESQDICFVPDGDYVRFIEHHAGCVLEPGPIVDGTGKALGVHRGLAAYTIGQRKGIGVAAAKPLYVLRKNVAANELVVGPADGLTVRGVVANDVNFIAVDEAQAQDVRFRVTAKTSYRQPARPAWATYEHGELRVEFDEGVRAPAPGQLVVAYLGDAVFAGATIRDILS